jgi:hypothetical protein
MEQGNMPTLDMKTGYNNRIIIIRRETAMRMLGVLLFYAVLFIAVSELSS